MYKRQDLGFDFVLTGHTHMHNISYCKIGNKKFYDISTAALTGCPPYYRQIVLNKEQKKAENNVNVNKVARPSSSSTTNK